MTFPTASKREESRLLLVQSFQENHFLEALLLLIHPRAPDLTRSGSTVFNNWESGSSRRINNIINTLINTWSAGIFIIPTSKLNQKTPDTGGTLQTPDSLFPLLLSPTIHPKLIKMSTLHLYWENHFQEATLCSAGLLITIILLLEQISKITMKNTLIHTIETREEDLENTRSKFPFLRSMSSSGKNNLEKSINYNHLLPYLKPTQIIDGSTFSLQYFNFFPWKFNWNNNRCDAVVNLFWDILTSSRTLSFSN